MNTLKKITLAASLSAAFLTGPAFAERDTIPHLDHVFLIMLENHGYSQIMGNNDAPFINQLAHSANLATNYFAVGHPSLTNYLEVVGGSNFGIENDNYPNWHNATPSASLNNPIAGSGLDATTPASIAPFNVEIPAAPYFAETIADQLVSAGQSWKNYQESLPASGVVDGVNLSDGIRQEPQLRCYGSGRRPCRGRLSERRPVPAKAPYSVRRARQLLYGPQRTELRHDLLLSRDRAGPVGERVRCFLSYAQAARALFFRSHGGRGFLS
jgi:hypothetical protein